VKNNVKNNVFKVYAAVFSTIELSLEGTTVYSQYQKSRAMNLKLKVL
jgi:hypothetical protein